ncbi:hypothetical protein ABTA99_19695, partial [Acinetobacter baumannii]
MKQMTEAGNCSKTTKTLPIGELIGTKAWDKLFSVDGNYQGVIFNVFTEEFGHPIGGFGVQFG